MTVNRKTRLFAVAITLALVLATFLAAVPASASDGCGECDNPGAGTPGYWKRHPEAWPVDMITIGDFDFTKDEALALMNMPVKGNKMITMFKALVAAELNLAIGNCNCIPGWITEGHRWFTWDGDDPFGYECGAPGAFVPASSECWQESHGELIYWWLDEYNNGRLVDWFLDWCPGPRD